MSRKVFRSLMVFLLVPMLASFTLISCGGGGGGGGGGDVAGGTPVSSSGVMTVGSVVLNGVSFSASGASIRIEDNPNRPQAELQDGMVVKVRGVRNDDGVTGIAHAVEAENELQGDITAIGADTMTVLGVQVFVDDRVVFANVANFAALGLGNVVSVHGLRNATGSVLATRVELLNPAAVDELKGVVATKDNNAGTFTLTGSSLVFNFDANTVMVGGTTFAVGDLVEVNLNGLLATRIELEDVEDAEFEPNEGQEVEVEGFVSNLAGDTFTVNGTQVQIQGSTKFRSGLRIELFDNIEVEVEGIMVGGVLMAEQIKFEDSVRIESNATASTANSVDILGKTVVTHSMTTLNNVALPVGAGTGVKIRGFMNGDGTITATRIDGINPVDADKHTLQGPVSAFDANAKSVTVVGITMDLSTPGLIIQGMEDQLISLNQFFASLTPNITVVKARGTFALPATLIANQVELEDRN